MKKDDKYTEALYIEKSKCIYSYIIGIFLYITLTILFKDSFELVSSITNTVLIVGSCSVVILTVTVLKIYEAIYYKIMCLFYLFIAIFNLGNLILGEEIKYKWSALIYSRITLYTTVLFLLIIVCLRMTEYVKEVKESGRKKYIFFYFCMILNYIWLECFNGYFMVQISNIIILYLCHLIRKNLGDYGFINEKRVNTLLSLTYISMVIIIINIFNAAFPGNPEIDILIRIGIFSGFISSVVITIDKLLNRPYKVLFSDLYRQNVEMNELNSEVVKKNRELEFSQAVIRKKERMFKTFFISVPVPLAIISKKGRVMFINSSFQELVDEENIKNIINKKIFSIIKNNSEEYMEYSRMEKRGIISGVFEGKKEEKFVDMELVDISNNKEETLIIFSDVTSKIKIGQLRAEMENNIFQERIKRDFLSNISHDLKTPINVIYSAAQLISVYVKSSNREALKKYNLISKLNCIGLIRLTNNLIDSSRIYSDYLSATLKVKNIVEIVEETVTSLIDYAKNKEISLLFDTDEEEIYVNFDDEFMQRIVINVVSNAIKFSKEGGTIEVIIKSLEDKVKLLIIDNGIGMEEEFIERAFSRYAMGKNNENRLEKGTGIGLFVVKKLVEKQNGEISIKSKINEGTEIEILFNKESYNG